MTLRCTIRNRWIDWVHRVCSVVAGSGGLIVGTLTACNIAQFVSLWSTESMEAFQAKWNVNKNQPCLKSTTERDPPLNIAQINYGAL
jgi:hypothetical protein